MVDDALTVCIVLLWASVLFKVAIAPVHAWFPEVLEGCQGAVSVLLLSVPKVALMSWLMVSAADVHCLLTLWAVVACSVLSIVLGSLMAYVQLSWRKLLGLSGTVQLGFVLCCCLGHGASMWLTVVLYMLFYGLVAVLLGSLLYYVAVGSGGRLLSFLAHGANVQPMWGLLVGLSCLNLVGLPPLLGFLVKVQVLGLIVAAGHPSVALMLFGMLVCSSLYYLRLLSWVSGALSSYGRVLTWHTVLGKGGSVLLAVCGFVVCIPYGKAGMVGLMLSLSL